MQDACSFFAHFCAGTSIRLILTMTADFSWHTFVKARITISYGFVTQKVFTLYMRRKTTKTVVVVVIKTSFILKDFTRVDPGPVLNKRKRKDVARYNFNYL